jgi:hypothetical protein
MVCLGTLLRYDTVVMCTVCIGKVYIYICIYQFHTHILRTMWEVNTVRHIY